MVGRDALQSSGRDIFLAGTAFAAPKESVKDKFPFRTRVLVCLALNAATWAVVLVTAVTIVKTLRHLAA